MNPIIGSLIRIILGVTFGLFAVLSIFTGNVILGLVLLIAGAFIIREVGL